jgi:hypothetical protein
MPEHASRFIGLYDQQNENRIPDWGGDELFTRMPSPPAVDDAPAPRFRPSLALVDAPEERRRTPPGEEWSGPRDRRRTPPGEEWSGPRDRRRRGSADVAMRERAERLGISVVESSSEAALPPREWDEAARRQSDEAPLEPVAPRDPEESPGVAAARMWEESGIACDWDRALEPPPERAPNGRRTTVITGRPERAPRPLSLAPAERRRPRRTPAEWIGQRPERIVAWAFVLGLLLILIAISTADAATV